MRRLFTSWPCHNSEAKPYLKSRRSWGILENSRKSTKETGHGRSVDVDGATGFLGSHLLANLLETDPDSQVICLARRRRAAARDRVFEALAAARHDQGALPVPADWQKRVLVFEEDLCSPSGLLGPQALAAMQTLRPWEFWHCAASVQFTETAAGEV